MTVLASFGPIPMQVVGEAPPLHLPDGFLSLPIALAAWALVALVLTIAVRRTESMLGERQIPLMGIMAAFVFAAQMINFPVVGGTSGHLLGGAFAAIVLGPWPAMLVMTAVVVVQALLFQDGGVLVMGANILNMGLLTVLIGYGLYRGVLHRGRGTRLAVAGIAAWLSVVAGALATAFQLWLSGTVRLDMVMPAMLSVHALIGVGEALITVAALTFILRTRPDLLAGSEKTEGGAGWAVGGLLVSLVVVFVSPLASTEPDGLERVAIDLGFLHRGSDAPYRVLPDYTIPFLGDTALSTIAAGTIGVVLVAAITIGVLRLVRRPPSPA